MVTGVLFLMLPLSLLLLVAFVYQILTTPLTAVDAPTLSKSAATPSAPAPAPPLRQPRAPAATGPAPRTASEGPSPGRRSWSTGLAIAGLAAVIMGGWLFLHIAPGGAACSPRAIEVCSQGFVLLTSTQLAGAATAVAGVGAIVMAAVLAMR